MSRRPCAHSSLAAVLAGALALLAPGTGHGFQSLADDSVTVPRGATFSDDLYVFANDATIEGTVEGDLFVFAQNARISGTVGGDLTVAGANVAVSGQVRGSLRAAGGELSLSSQVGEDAVAAGGTVRLAEGARTGRDAALAGGTVIVAGAVGRALKAAGGELRLDGTVASNASLDGDRIFVAPQASVGGDLTWSAATAAQLAPEARVGGARVERPVERPGPWASAAAFLLAWTRALIGFFLLGLILVLALPKTAARAARGLRFAPGQTLALGLLAFLLVPPLAAAVFALGLLVGGWWIGLLVLATFAILLFFAFSTSGLALGRLLLRERSDRRGPLALELLLGLVLLLLVALVPVLGAVVVMLALVWGLGTLLRAIGTRSAPLPA